MIPETFDAVTLRLLRLFETVYQTRNVSQAADRLGVSQPSVSLSLNRLRECFDDPLFVRVGANMEPTPRAEVLIEAIQAMLRIANDEFVARAPFDPLHSQRCFTLHMTDLGETLLVPRLVNQLARLAPGTKLKVRQIDEDSQGLLASGGVDLILGYLARAGEDLVQRKLFDEIFVCIARVDHPRVQGTLTIEQFCSEAHINVAIAGTGHAQVERSFDRMRVDEQPALELPGFLAVGGAVAQTDLLAAVPSRLGRALADRGDVRVFALPFDGPTLEVRQYWHSRFNNDAGNRWLRGVISDLFQDREPPSIA